MAAQLVKIVTTEMNVRTASLRARISDAVAIKKVNDPAELRDAERRADEAYAKWKAIMF